MATNSQQIFVNTDGNFTEALTSFVKNFEDVDASQASGKINVIGTDSEGSVTIDMNTVGGSGDDSLTTGSGADTINGGAGNDIINASGGDDSVFGGDGSDVIRGGKGTDILKGGFGSDTFIFETVDLENNVIDVISDLQSGKRLGLIHQYPGWG